MGTPPCSATGAAADTSAAKSGPMISSAPSRSALSAAIRAPSGEPLVSLGISVTFGLSKSNRASSAACFSALATAGVEPEELIGSSTATLTLPVEPVMPEAPGPIPPPPGAPQAASTTLTSRLAKTSLSAAK